MNIKFRFILTPMLIGAIAVSCDKKDMEDISPANTLTSETTSAATSANVFYNETFEGSDPFSTAHSIEIGASHSLTYVTNPAFEGSKSARFELRESDPIVKTGKRAEVTIIKGENLPGKEMWYSYAVYFPADYAKDSEPEIINQWFQDRSPATALRTEDDRMYLHTGNESEPDNRVKLDLGAIDKGKWTTLVFHFVHSHGSDGLIEVWKNGAKAITRNGGNMYNVDIMPKFKVGLYKSAFKYGTSDVDKRVVYFDNIKVGNGNASLAEMNPATGSATAPITTEPAPAPTEPAPAPTEPVLTPTEPAPAPSTTTQGIVSFTLVDAETNKDIKTITNGSSISLEALNVDKINVRANTGTSTVNVVKFELSGAETKTRLDDAAPYALFGDDRKGDYYSWDPNYGSYTLKATPHSGTKSKIGAATGPTYSISFTITR